MEATKLIFSYNQLSDLKMDMVPTNFFVLFYENVQKKFVSIYEMKVTVNEKSEHASICDNSLHVYSSQEKYYPDMKIKILKSGLILK